MPDDPELLRRYADTKSDAAFAELVRRYIDLVYAVALRQVGGNAHLAEDVAQQVFTALARKAGSLAGRPVLGGWLYRAAHYAAIDAVRVEARRRGREQEAQIMHELTSDTESAADWDKLRPLLDRAIGELGEVDRDAVVLRFFNGCSFAEVGAKLRLSENAARMRVERALDKLHAALARRGVTSTTAAIGAVLVNSVGAAAPTGMAASVSSAALAGAAAAGGGIATVAGWLGLVSTAKIAAVVTSIVAVGGVGTAVNQRQRAVEAQTALASAVRQQHALHARLGALEDSVRSAEQRAADAERDNGELLKAIETFRAQQAARLAQTNAGTGGAGTGAVIGGAGNDEWLGYERAYQQELARRRAEDARERARLEYEMRLADPAEKFIRLVDSARQYAAKAEFQSAIRRLNQAMQVKPPAMPVADDVKELQSMLAAQNTPVDVPFVSDGTTFVSVGGFRAPAQFKATTMKILPGDYEVIGQRRGYRDVRMLLQVRASQPAPEVSVRCTVPEQ